MARYHFVLAHLLLAYSSATLAANAAVIHSSITVGKDQRSFVAYIPANLKPQAPVVLALHGSYGTGEDMRRQTGYGFEKLADQHGIVVIYPDGYDKNWNDCRKAATYTARQLQMNDVGFMRALIKRFEHSHQINPQQVYAMGYSSGGQMVFRLGIEAPALLAGLGVVAASFPAPDNHDCALPNIAKPMVVINGSSDPMNPYQGGNVALYGLFASRGNVLSTSQTVDQYRRLAGITSAPVTSTLSTASGFNRTWTQRQLWRSAHGMPVALYTVHQGGHAIPQAQYAFSIFLGATEQDIDTATELWRIWRLPQTPQLH